MKSYMQSNQTTKFYASNLPETKVKKKLFEFFGKSAIKKTGKQSGFIMRQALKITAFDFVLDFLQ